MADSASASRQPHLIAGLFGVDTSRPLPGAGGGLPAFAATSAQTAGTPGRTRLMALPVQLHLAPRVRVLQALTEPMDGLLSPLAHGVFAPPGGAAGYYVICPAPPGPALSDGLKPWSEAALIQFVLRPLARVLDQLAARGLTHRAIRPDNVFQGSFGQSAVLGAAWTAPPASLQPAAAEPVYAAMCLPSGRGDGGIADDVYALGVLLIALALGRMPLAGLDDETVIRLKLEHGSFAALTGQERLPPLIADLARGMLAEDPEHRPPPAMLLDPHTARARRVAARPPRRAQRAIVLAGRDIWDCRALAFAMATQPDQAAQTLRGGIADRWIRRSLGDAAMASQMEDAVRQRAAQAGGDDARADATLVMRAIAVLDPLAPLCWDRLALWPDGIGGILTAAADDPAVSARIEAVIDTEAPVVWAAVRQERCDETAIRLEARQQRGWLRLRGVCGGLPRLRYALNPLRPCDSKTLDGRFVAHVADLPAALEQVAAQSANRPELPIDGSIATFVAARAERQSEADLVGVVDAGPEARLGQLRVLARLQTRYHPAPLPKLAAWIAESAEMVLATWRNRQRRAEIRDRLAALVRDGQLAPMLAILDDAAARNADAMAAQKAEVARRALDTALQAIETAGPDRADLATRLGQEIAAALALGALVATLGFAAIG